MNRPIRITKTAARLFYRRIPYIALFSLSLYLLLFLGIRAYYRYMPASWFIHITKDPVISSGAVGDTLTLTFCRTTRYPDINAVGARSYYLILDGKEQPAGDYEFEAKIEQNRQCQYVPIKPTKHPNKAGTYLAHTDLTFYAQGHKKVLSYETSTFRLTDTAKSLKQQIDDLQEQIDNLRRQESSLTATTTPAPAVSSPLSSQSMTSGATSNSPSAPQSQASNAQQLIAPITSLLDLVLK